VSSAAEVNCEEDGQEDNEDCCNGDADTETSFGTGGEVAFVEVSYRHSEGHRRESGQEKSKEDGRCLELRHDGWCVIWLLLFENECLRVLYD